MSKIRDYVISRIREEKTCHLVNQCFTLNQIKDDYIEFVPRRSRGETLSQRIRRSIRAKLRPSVFIVSGFRNRSPNISLAYLVELGILSKYCPCFSRENEREETKNRNLIIFAEKLRVCRLHDGGDW